jgi:hypothetical protein
VNKRRRQRIWLAVGCLMCFFLALRNTKGLKGTEFSGGWLTGPLLSMTDVGTILFAIAFIAAFFFPRIAAGLRLYRPRYACLFICILWPPCILARSSGLNMNSKFRRARGFMSMCGR